MIGAAGPCGYGLSAAKPSRAKGNIGHAFLSFKASTFGFF